MTKLAKTRSLADARVVVCAGAMLPEAQLQPSNTEYKSGRMRLGRSGGDTVRNQLSMWRKDLTYESQTSGLFRHHVVCNLGGQVLPE